MTATKNYDYNPAPDVGVTDYYSDSDIESAEEDYEPYEWTPNVCSYEEFEYGDDATLFVADEHPFIQGPNPIIYVDGEWWNACEYSAHKADLAFQADQESKRAAHIEKLAWLVRMRRGLPTESRLGRIKRMQSDKEAKDRKFICAANAKKAPKFGTRRSNAPTRKGKRGIVVAEATVVAERRKLRRREAKAAQALRACTKPVVAMPILTPDAYIPKPEDEETAEIEAAEQAEIEVVCATPKQWVPITAPVAVERTREAAWTVVSSKSKTAKQTRDGFVKKGNRGRAAKCVVLNFEPPPPVRPPSPTQPAAVPAGWVFTHPCMDLRAHITDDTPLCRHFQFGNCNFASTCKFRHTYGACKFGAKCTRAGCKRAHPRPPSVGFKMKGPDHEISRAEMKAGPPRVRRAWAPTPAPTPTPTPTPPPAPAPAPEPANEFGVVFVEGGGFRFEVEMPHYLTTPPGPPLGPPPPLVFPTKPAPAPAPVVCKPVPAARKPTRTCNTWAAGKECKFGSGCSFAHFNIPKKTCKFWELGQQCKHGSKCRFKHG